MSPIMAQIMKEIMLKRCDAHVIDFKTRGVINKIE